MTSRFACFSLPLKAKLCGVVSAWAWGLRASLIWDLQPQSPFPCVPAGPYVGALDPTHWELARGWGQTLLPALACRGAPQMSLHLHGAITP